MDEAFGESNFITTINFVTANAQTGTPFGRITLTTTFCNTVSDKTRSPKHLECPFLPKTDLKKVGKQLINSCT